MPWHPRCQSSATALRATGLPCVRHGSCRQCRSPGAASALCSSRTLGADVCQYVIPRDVHSRLCVWTWLVLCVVGAVAVIKALPQRS